MTRPSILLIESLDCAGAAPDDALLKIAALRAAGFAARALVVGPAPSSGALPPMGGVPTVIPRREASAAARRALAERATDLVLVTSAAPGAEEFARGLPAGRPARWWPGAIVAGSPQVRRIPWPAARGLEPLAATPKSGLAASSHAALDWAVVDESALTRRRYPLWDGEYLLAPLPLGGDPGEELLDVFAAAARDRASLDLIVLADPQPAYERQARARGIGPRVHFVGRATREAEWAWLAEAAAALIAGPGPLAGGVALRALACGCPIVTLGSSGVGPVLGAWLEGRGLSGAPGPALDRLTRALERPAEVVRAIEQGKRLSAGHRRAGIAGRLASALSALRAPTAPRRVA